MFRTIALALTAAAALAACTTSAGAATLTISGDCRGCEPAIAPAPGLAFGAIAQTLRATGIAERTSVTAHVVTPAGTVELQPCRPLFRAGETVDVPGPYRGNGSYTAVLRSWPMPPGQFTPACDGPPAREDSISYSIAAGASVSVPAETVLIKRGDNGKRIGSAPVTADAGLNVLELAYAHDPQPAPDGSLTGAKTVLGANNGISSTTTSVGFTEPGSYGVVGRPLSTTSYGPGLEPDAPGPWSAAATFTALQRFDLATGAVLDTTAPTYTVKLVVSPTEARGDRVTAALGVCTSGTCKDNTPGAFKRFRSIGTATVGPGGVVTFKGIRLPRGVVAGIRLTHPGNSIVVAGSAIQGVRVFKHSGTAKLRTIHNGGVPVPAR